jgi:hypothetical protein
MRSHLVSAIAIVSSAVALSTASAACGGGKAPNEFDNVPDKDAATTTEEDSGFEFDGGSVPVFQGDGSVHGGNLDAGCATATAATTRQPVYMLFVLDGSNSMNQDSKWKAVIPALDAIFDDILTQNDTALGVGLIGFEDSNDKACTGIIFPTCKYPSSADVPIAFVDKAQHDKLRARIDTANAAGGTPTQLALTGAYGSIDAFTPSGKLEPGGKKVLVLMTDGVPNGGPTEQDACISMATNELAAAPPKGPVTTFSVGIGPFPSTNTAGYDPAFMGKLAKAGGAAPTGCNPTENVNVANACHFQVTPNGKPVAQITSEFIAAINKIRGQVSSCEFLLDKLDGGSLDPKKVNVVFTDGAGTAHTIAQNPTDGWTYDDPNNPSKVILHGKGCGDMKADAKGKISIVIGCETEIETSK